jgi:hypothetical protein
MKSGRMPSAAKRITGETGSDGGAAGAAGTPPPAGDASIPTANTIVRNTLTTLLDSGSIGSLPKTNRSDLKIYPNQRMDDQIIFNQVQIGFLRIFLYPPPSSPPGKQNHRATKSPTNESNVERKLRASGCDAR